MLENAGFKDIQIKQEQLGSYVSLSEAKNWWKGDRTWIHPKGNPFLKLSSEELKRLKTAYDREIENLLTDKGVWHDITVFFVLGHK